MVTGKKCGLQHGQRPQSTPTANGNIQPPNEPVSAPSNRPGTKHRRLIVGRQPRHAMPAASLPPDCPEIARLTLPGPAGGAVHHVRLVCNPCKPMCTLLLLAPSPRCFPAHTDPLVPRPGPRVEPTPARSTHLCNSWCGACAGSGHLSLFMTCQPLGVYLGPTTFLTCLHSTIPSHHLACSALLRISI